MDLFIRATTENVARLRAALKASYADDPHIDDITAADPLGDYPAVRYYPPSGDLYFDILTRLGEAASFDTVEAETKEVEGTRVNQTRLSVLEMDGRHSPRRVIAVGGLGRAGRLLPGHRAIDVDATGHGDGAMPTVALSGRLQERYSSLGLIPMDNRPLHPWFTAGHAAFSRAFPHLVSQVPFDPFYVCPQCLHAFGPDAWDHRVITRDHVPPKCIGGQRLTLTCQRCNNDVGGSELDSHMRLEADFYDFMSGNMAQTPVRLMTDAGGVPIELSVTDGSMMALGVPGAVHPDEHQRVMSSFDEATQAGGWHNFHIIFEFKPFSKERAATGWLRAAYLALFATLGYRFVMRPELHEVRATFRDPENHNLRNFRVTTPTFTREPTLVRIDSPDAFRSYAMLYRHHVVLLPRYGDGGLYQRLGAEGEHVQVVFSGVGYPWPADSPTFFHDSLGA